MRILTQEEIWADHAPIYRFKLNSDQILAIMLKEHLVAPIGRKKDQYKTTKQYFTRK